MISAASKNPPLRTDGGWQDVGYAAVELILGRPFAARERERERVYLASRSLICYFTIIVVFWVLVARSVTMMMKQDDEALKKTNDDGD